MTHLSFSDRKQAETFYNGFQNGKIPGINDDGAPVEVSWVAGPASTLPGSTTSSVNPTGAGGDGLDSAMDDAEGGETRHHNGGSGDEDGKDGLGSAQGEPHTQQQHNQQQQQQQQQQEAGEAKEVDYDVAGENEWDE